jgi:hypothetical protein
MRVEEEEFFYPGCVSAIDRHSPPDAAAPAFHQLMPLSSSAQPASHPTRWALAAAIKQRDSDRFGGTLLRAFIRL